MNALRVAVVGGGLGGLCLAHGLLKAEMGARRGKLMFWLYRRVARAGT